MNISRLQRRLAPILTPVSAVYSLLMRLRAASYRKIPHRAHRAGQPVISVGNISWGGTGKTPLTEWLLTWAGQKGLSGVVLTRGYGASPPTFPFSVGQQAEVPYSGDEPLFLARRHPEALVLVDPKRSRSAAWAEKNAKPDLFIMDDGMQHMALWRDINLVLLRPEDMLEEWNRVIPAGSWREPASALARADAFLLRADERLFPTLAPVARKRLQDFNKPIFSFYLEPTGIRRLTLGLDAPVIPASGSGEGLDACAAAFGGSEYLLVSAVGNPGPVLETAKAVLGKAPIKHIIHPDHHPYSAEDIEALTSADLPLVCTAKDAVKLVRHLPLFGAQPVWVLEVGVRFGPSLLTCQSFPQWWEEAWQRVSASYRRHPA